MPNVDDHGLEVLKKAARNLDPVPKKDYAIQTILVGDESVGGGIYTPTILNFSIPTKDIEVELSLPVGCKAFVLRPRKNSRLRIAYTAGGTTSSWASVPLGGYWVENKRLSSNKVFVQSSKDNNTIEIVAYT